MLQQAKSISKKAKSKACTGNQNKLQTQQTKPRAIQIAICLQVKRLSKFTSDPDCGLGRRFATKSHSCSFRTRKTSESIDYYLNNGAAYGNAVAVAVSTTLNYDNSQNSIFMKQNSRPRNLYLRQFSQIDFHETKLATAKRIFTT